MDKVYFMQGQIQDFTKGEGGPGNWNTVYSCELDVLSLIMKFGGLQKGLGSWGLPIPPPRILLTIAKLYFVSGHTFLPLGLYQ